MHYVFLHEYNIHGGEGGGGGGDRLFFNFPFVCLSTLQIRATITTSCCSRWLSIAELSSVKSDRVAWFFAFCFLISSCNAGDSCSLHKTRRTAFFFSAVFFFSFFQMFSNSFCYHYYFMQIYLYLTVCGVISDTLSCDSSINNRCFILCAFIFARTASDALSRKGVLLAGSLSPTGF